MEYDMNQKTQKSMKIAFIQSLWHFEIVDKSRDGFNTYMQDNNFNCSTEIFQVPGAFDIPLLAKKLANTGEFDAIVASGFIVDGGIYHHEFVSTAVIDGLMQVQLETLVPVISAVLTPHNFQECEAHINFFANHFVDKGVEAASACVKIIDNMRQLNNQLSSTAT